MKVLCALLGLLVATNVHAASWKTVTKKTNSKNYESNLTYPVLLPGSVPAYRTINKNLKANIMEGACDADEAAKSENGFNYDVQGTVVALNKNYVGVSLATDDYCGGAHPNNGTYYLTFNSKTGQILNISLQFGFRDYDDPKYNFDEDTAQRLKVAEILVKHIPDDVNENCFANMTPAQKLDEMVTLFPVVAGLAKGGKVVLGTSPAHVVEVCEFFVRLDYKDVKSLIVKGSYLEKWLNKATTQPSLTNLMR